MRSVDMKGTVFWVEEVSLCYIRDQLIITEADVNTLMIDKERRVWISFLVEVHNRFATNLKRSP